jgi:hypothetical protein
MSDKKTKFIDRSLEELLLKDIELRETIDPNYDRAEREVSCEWLQKQGVEPHIAALLFGL